MTETHFQLFSQASLLMLVGMVFVFLFLSLLIFCIAFIIAPLGKKFPDQMKNDENQADNNQDIPPQVIAAISAAIQKYRQSQ